MRNLAAPQRTGNCERSEQAALGCLIEEPAKAWPQFDRYGVNVDWFRSSWCPAIFRHCVEIRADGLDVSLPLVGDRLLRENAPPEAISYAAALESEVESQEQIGSYLTELQTAKIRRDVRVAAIQLQGVAEDPGTPIEQLAKNIEDLRSSIQARQITSEVDTRRFNISAKPPEIRPIYALVGTPICTPGNLTSITAHAKVGKSAFLNALLAAPMAIVGSDTFGISSQNRAGKAVLHFDTEQSKEDHWHQVMRAVRRAGLSVPPPWLLSYCLTGFDAKKALAAVLSKVEEAAQEFSGIHSVHIDGFADLVCDVNDPAECNAFVARLHALAIQFECALPGVIHFNPNTEKTRGHLGSQLERKAETNLRLDKDGEVTEVWSEKQRRAPIFKGKGPRFRWSDEAGMHVSVESGFSAKESEKREGAKNLRDDIFNGRPAMRWSELEKEVQTTLKKSESTAKRILREWVQFSLITKSIAGLWTPAN